MVRRRWRARWIVSSPRSSQCEAPVRNKPDISNAPAFEAAPESGLNRTVATKTKVAASASERRVCPLAGARGYTFHETALTFFRDDLRGSFHLAAGDAELIDQF